jgi:DNA modification methylase
MPDENVQQIPLLEQEKTTAPDKAEESQKEQPPNKASRANELDGKTWTKYSISIWSDITKSSEESLLGHPAIFPVSLVSRLIEIFTNRHHYTVLDPFAGVESTVVAAKRLGKHGIGIELSAHYVQIARMRCEQATMFEDSAGLATIHNANALQLLDYIAEQSIDLAVTSPPYWIGIFSTRNVPRITKILVTMATQKAILGLSMITRNF